ncbi:hypothetical protein QYB59_000006 [Clostridium perfringens]|nr:hypothetical protein [Clostridium perfringens]
MKKNLISKLTVLATTGTLCTSIFAPSVTTLANEIKPTTIVSKTSTSNTLDNILKKENISEKDWSNFVKLVKDNSINDVNSSKERGLVSAVPKLVKKALKYLIKHIDIIPSKTVREAIQKYGGKIVNAIDSVETWTWYGITNALTSAGVPYKYADAIADFIVNWIL